MKDLPGAIEAEKQYVKARLNGENVSIYDALADYGYSDLDEYFADKREYLFALWKPEVYEVDAEWMATKLWDAIKNGEYGVLVYKTDHPFVYHGTEDIDYALCAELGMDVVELGYNGGSLVGTADDLGLMVIAPADIGLDANYFLQKYQSILAQSFDNVAIDNNDILIDGKKVMGGYSDQVGGSFVYASQFSFADSSALIAQICKKQSAKTPGYIDPQVLSCGQLKQEVLAWLQKA